MVTRTRNNPGVRHRRQRSDEPVSRRGLSGRSMSDGAPGARQIVPLRRLMSGRDPNEVHRASTPLELLFDLCFVVAVSQAAAELHHALAQGHTGTGVFGYLLVFFAIWWAWVNFTWFASAYDTDDVAYRLLTLLQMAGVLLFAVGVPAGLRSLDFTVMTLGYVIMRIALIAQWLRAAHEHPAGRPAAVRYAMGVATVQIGWLLRLALPHPVDYVAFGVLAVAELAVPVWAEYRGTLTSWHPEHIAERYGLFTLIVLGEAILGTTAAIQSSLGEHGVSGSLIMLAAGALLLVFALWWAYFKSPAAEGLRGSLRTTLGWAYGHYLVFGSVAALGAGFEVAVEAEEHPTHVSQLTAALSVAIPAVVFLIVLMRLQRRIGVDHATTQSLVIVTAVLVLATGAAATVVNLGLIVLIMGGLVAALVAASLTLSRRQRPSPGPGQDKLVA
jgi:low temperature requirement protein LtrA